MFLSFYINGTMLIFFHSLFFFFQIQCEVYLLPIPALCTANNILLDQRTNNFHIYCNEIGRTHIESHYYRFGLFILYFMSILIISNILSNLALILLLFDLKTKKSFHFPHVHVYSVHKLHL